MQNEPADDVVRGGGCGRALVQVWWSWIWDWMECAGDDFVEEFGWVIVEMSAYMRDVLDFRFRVSRRKVDGSFDEC